MIFLIYFGIIVEVAKGNILRKFHNFGCLKGNIEIQNGNLVFNEYSADSDDGYTFLLHEPGGDYETFSEINTDFNIKSKTVIEYNSKHNLQKSSPMLINELAHFNNIEVTYSLIAEHGPAHQKIFAIQLKIGNEEYEGIGRSLKQARKIAAAKALKNTKFEHPPLKDLGNELYELAKKRNEEVIFINEYGQLITSSKDLQNPTLFPANNVHKLHNIRIENHENKSGHENVTDIKNTTGDYLQNLQMPDDPSIIRLKVGDREYIGTGYSITAARHDATVKAIEEMKRMNSVDENTDKSTTSTNIQTKSPVSLIYETATKRDKRVVFSVIKEEGPPHAKLFTSRCQVDEMIVEAEGFSKKSSKQSAAKLMLEKLLRLGWLVSPSSNKVTKARKNRRKNKINKENVQVSVEIPEIVYEKEPTLINEAHIIKRGNYGKHKKSMKDTLIELAKRLGISVQYWDIPKNNYEKYMTFVALDLTPSQVCFGIDSVLETSRNIASLNALEELERHGLDNVYTNNIKQTRKSDYIHSTVVGDKKQFHYSYQTKIL